MQSEKIPVENRWSVNSFVALDWYWQWLAFSLLALVVYFPIIGNTFLSDDHLVLLKTGVEQQLNVDGFFRPLSDITLWLTYRFVQTQSSSVLCFPNAPACIECSDAAAVLPHSYCCSNNATNHHAGLMALLAGILFLTYPFHNEAIAWILGRGSLMAGSFAIAAMLALVSDWKMPVKISVIAACYFVGLMAYETIIILPLLVALQMLFMRAPLKQVATMLTVLVVGFALHAWLRIAVSGAFLGGYGEGFFQSFGLNTLLSMLKSAGRILLPPSDNSQAMMIRFCYGAADIGRCFIHCLEENEAGCCTRACSSIFNLAASPLPCWCRCGWA